MFAPPPRHRLALLGASAVLALYACTGETSSTPASLDLDAGGLSLSDAAVAGDATLPLDGASGVADGGDPSGDGGAPDGAPADGAPDATTDDAADLDAAADDAAVDGAMSDACALGTVLACDLDAGVEHACGADGGVAETVCAEGCHPDAGRCIAPLSVYAGPDLNVPLDGSAPLSAVVTGGVGPYAYLWAPAAELDDASSPQPTVTPTSTTPFIVTVTDVRAKTASDTVLVKVPDAPLALARWTVVDYPAGQAAASWSFLDGGLVAVQSVNADPSLLVADFSLTAGYEVTGRFAVTAAAGDDDFIGFAFGYQDPTHFYLFDWKATAQTNGGCGSAARGMTLRKFASDVDLTCLSLWGTTATDAGATILSPANNVPWVAGTFYEFKLTHEASGAISIEVKNAATQAVVGSLSASDTTWPVGKFAFYNYSQANGRYEFFRARDLP